MVAAIPTAGSPRQFELAYSRLTGPWRSFATLEVTQTPHRGELDLSFDPGLMGALRNKAPALALGLVGMRRDADAPVPAQMSAPGYLQQVLVARLQFLAYRVADLTSAPTQSADPRAG